MSKNHSEAKSSLPWYKEGLRFQCTECGRCCTGAPGYVWITEEEIEAMAVHLNMTVQAFKIKYTRQRENRYALVERQNVNHEYDCVFLREKKCMIYPVRPKQCRTFPWWQENLNSEESWKEAARYCEGIQNRAPVVPYAKIEEQLRQNNQSR